MTFGWTTSVQSIGKLSWLNLTFGQGSPSLLPFPLTKLSAFHPHQAYCLSPSPSYSLLANVVRANVALRKCHYTVKMLSFHRPGSAITNGREPRSCLGRVFNSKLGCLATPGRKFLVWCMQPLLKLKTRPKARPVSLNLSMHWLLRKLSWKKVL